MPGSRPPRPRPRPRRPRPRPRRLREDCQGGLLRRRDRGAGLDGPPEAQGGLLHDRDRPEHLLDLHGPQVADPEDPPLELPLAAGDHETPLLELAVEGLPIEVLGNPGGSDGLRGVGGLGEQGEAKGHQAGAGGRGAGGVTGEDAVGRLLLHEAEALVDLVEDRDGRRPGRLAGGRALAGAPQVEVEARHPRGLHRRPRALGRRRRRPARGRTSRPSGSRSRRGRGPRRPSRRGPRRAR